MSEKNQSYLNSLDRTISAIVGREKLYGQKILITGSTGTIGSWLVDTLLRMNEGLSGQEKIQLYLAVHSSRTATGGLSREGRNEIHFVPYDLHRDLSLDEKMDYIIHAAGAGHPQAFADDPVGTLTGAVDSTRHLLEYAKSHGVRRLLYVSSGEVYGIGDVSLPAYEETYSGYLDPTAPRSCYPMGKRAAENLCASWTAQYGLETVIVRPSHTYGPWITSNDSRAHAEFLRKAMVGEEIVLKSKGSQVRSYTFVADCISGLLSVLLSGIAGEAYNLSNGASVCSIAEWAETLAEVSGGSVRYDLPNEEDRRKFTPIPRQVLDCRKLEALGWHGCYNLSDGIHALWQIAAGEEQQR